MQGDSMDFDMACGFLGPPYWMTESHLDDMEMPIRFAGTAAPAGVALTSEWGGGACGAGGVGAGSCWGWEQHEPYVRVGIIQAAHDPEHPVHLTLRC
jgi:hypothetical protein